jgi:hypothetical protein
LIRSPVASDQGYIAATWARSMLSTHAHQRHMRSRTGQQIGQQIDAVLDRPDTRAWLCVRDHEPQFIRGWVLFVDGPSTPTVHYLYTRRDERGCGVAGALLAKLGVDRAHGVVCTSLGPSSESMRGRYRASVYMPIAEFLK